MGALTATHVGAEPTRGLETAHLVGIKLLPQSLPDGLVAKAPLSQCRATGSIPGWELRGQVPSDAEK